MRWGMRSLAGKIAIAALAAVTLSATPAAANLLGNIGDLRYTQSREKNPAEGGDGIRAGCSDPYRITGGGVRMLGPAGNAPREIHVAETYPRARQWAATLLYFEAPGPPNEFRVYAICDRDSDVRIKTASAPADSLDPEPWFVSVDCPDGRHVVGGGVNGGVGHSPGGPADYVNSSYPRDSVEDDNTKRDDGWQAFGFQQAGENVDIEVYAICSKGPMPEYAEATRSGISAVDDRRATCPGGAHAVGGGAFLSGASAEAHLVATSPRDLGDGDAAPDDAWDSTASVDAGAPKNLTTHVICLP